ncbi:MAG: hypothetical protein NZM00_13915 [Anaerolinea sp.]|nr:hypothetical protein [Anaerolinea sp.]
MVSQVKWKAERDRVPPSSVDLDHIYNSVTNRMQLVPANWNRVRAMV